MARPELQSLCAELHRRSWSDDDLTDRVLIHASEATVPVPAGPSQRQPAIRARVLDGSDAVALATHAAASDLSAMSLQPGLRIRERDLADAIGEHLSATVERRVPVPGWDPQPGNVDVFTRNEEGRPLVVVETKLKDDNSIFECLWDMAKVLSLATAESNRGAYIVCGTTLANRQAGHLRRAL